MTDLDIAIYRITECAEAGARPYYAAESGNAGLVLLQERHANTASRLAGVKDVIAALEDAIQPAGDVTMAMMGEGTIVEPTAEQASLLAAARQVEVEACASLDLAHEVIREHLEKHPETVARIVAIDTGRVS